MNSSEYKREGTFEYAAFGLRIRSAWPLPELVPATESSVIPSDPLSPNRGQSSFDADDPVRIHPVSDGETLLDTLVSGQYHRVDAETAYLHWDEAGTFRIRRGREIAVMPTAGAEEHLLRLYLLGPVMAVLLHQRGRLVLHASAVAMTAHHKHEGEGVVAFMGGSGWGKSTLAAALHDRGHRVVTDDLVSVRMHEGRPLVDPGYSRLKLWPESVEGLGHSLESLPRLNPEGERRFHPASSGFSLEPIPLHGVYVLTEGPDIEIEALRPQEAFMELARHAYLSGHLDPSESPLQFRQITAIVKSVAVRRLQRPRDWNVLPSVLDQVEADIMAVSSTND